MTVPKVTAPSPAIFTSDPTEQIYAKSVVDRSNDMSGLSYMMLNAAQMQRERGQGAYMSGVSEANRMSAALAQNEERNKLNIEIMKQAVELAIKGGVNPSAMPVMGGIIADNSGPNDDFAKAMRAVEWSKAAQNNASAANQGQDQYQQETVMTPSGVAMTTMKSKGRNPTLLDAMQAQRAMEDAKRRGLVVDPNNPMKLPMANPTDAATARSLRYPNTQ